MPTVGAERVSSRSLAEALHGMGALRLREFTLPNGRRSSYDIDLRLVPSHPEIYTTVLAAYVELVEGVGEANYDGIVGVATAGLTMSSPLAIMLKKPMLYVRKEGEGRGQDRLVEGEAPRGSKLLIVDDLVASGTSLVSATAALRSKGYRVEDTAVLVDRMEGGGENLAAVGVKLHAYTTIGDLLGGLEESGLVGRGKVQEILARAEVRRSEKAGPGH